MKKILLILITGLLWCNVGNAGLNEPGTDQKCFDLFEKKKVEKKKEPKKKMSEDIVQQLKDLNELYKSGVLTKEEFEKAKKKVLSQ